MTIPGCLEDKKTHLHSQLAGLTPSDLYTVKPFIPILNHYYEVLLVPISTFPLCLSPIPDVLLHHCLYC